MKAIFCGTPEIAVPSLLALAEVAEIVGVVCQPDRPAGRGMKLRVPAVKLRALEMGLSVHQPVKVRDGALARWIRERECDVAVVIAYGRILTAETLAAPRLGCVNLHASLLPRYRGAAPIQRAIMDGCEETGVCLMKMDEGMDTGDILATRTLAILPDDDAGSLATKLGILAAQITREEVPRYVSGQLTPIPQDHHAASHAPPITPDEAYLDFSLGASSLHNRVRGLNPHPGAKTVIEREGQKNRGLKLHETRPLEALPSGEPMGAGEIVLRDGRVFVGTGTGVLEILVAQVEGKRPQSARDLVNGRSLLPGDHLGSR